MKPIDKERALETLKEFIRYPHPQNDLNRVRNFISEVVKPKIEPLPFDQMEIDDRGNLIAQIRTDSSSPPFVVCTYAGAYPQENMKDAYIPQVVDGEKFGLKGPCMWGRSTTEQLSGGAAMVEAVTAFFQEKPVLKRGFVWVTNYSGEMGNHEAVTHIFIENHTPMGPTLLATASNNCICIGNLGRVDIVMTVQGASCHSSDPSKGRNSIDGLQEILGKIDRFPHLKTDPELGKATLTPTTIRTWPDALHTVPAFTRLVLDRRLVPGEDPEFALNQMKEYIGELSSGLSLSFEEKLNFQYPHKADLQCRLVAAAEKAAREAVGEARTIYKRSALDMGFFSHYGQDCITFGPGNPALAHSDHEMVPLSDYYGAAQAYEILLEQMLSAPDAGSR